MMSCEAQATTSPRRRWFQYSLRTLLVFVLLAALACSYFAVKLKQASNQRESARALSGGMFLHEHSRPTWVHDLEQSTGLPIFDLFNDVYKVWMTGGWRDNDLEHLKGFPGLRSLALEDNSHITNEGLTNLKGLTKLEELELANNSMVTDRGLEYLKGLGRLRRLKLEGTRVTDLGVKEFKQALPKCEIVR